MRPFPVSARRCLKRSPRIAEIPPALWAALALASSGCIGVLEAGYVNRADLEKAGGASIVARATALDVRDDLVAGPDFALRADAASSGSRFAFGTGVTAMTQPGWVHDWSPYARGTLWVSPARGGPAAGEAPIAAGIDLGALFYPSHGSSNRSVWELGARVDDTFDGHGDARSLVGGFYIGIGSSTSLTIPR